MTTTNAIGNRIELIAKELMESQGFLTHRAIRAYRPIGPGRLINVSTDIYGVVDLLGIQPGRKVLAVQVTAHSGIGKKKDDILSVKNWPLDHMEVQIWKWMGRKMEKGMTRQVWRDWQYFRVIRLVESGVFEEAGKLAPTAAS